MPDPMRPKISPHDMYYCKDCGESRYKPHNKTFKCSKCGSKKEHLNFREAMWWVQPMIKPQTYLNRSLRAKTEDIRRVNLYKCLEAIIKELEDGKKKIKKN